MWSVRQANQVAAVSLCRLRCYVMLLDWNEKPRCCLTLTAGRTSPAASTNNELLISE